MFICEEDTINSQLHIKKGEIEKSWEIGHLQIV